MSNNPSNSKFVYENRIIVFIDFLGFKEIIEETEKHPDTLEQLIVAMEALSEIGDKPSFESQMVTQFSDSIVLSYRTEEISGVFWLLNEVAWAVIDLASRGYLLRGAVTCGPLLHTNRHVVGPAMVKAYLMESRIAKYPRVIIDSDLLKIAKTHRSEQHSPSEEANYVQHFMQLDSDDEYYFDYISWKPVVESAGVDDNSYGPYLERVSRLVLDGLKHADCSVLEKYLWLHRHYLSALDNFADLPADHPYRSQSPKNCTIMESLPRFENEAKLAHSKISGSNVPS